MKVVKVKLEDLNPDPNNTMVHDERNIEAIKTSLQKFKQYRAFVVQKKGMIIRVGNGMFEAMKQLGYKEAFAEIKTLTDEEATALSIMDNKSSDLASFDDPALAEAFTIIPEDLHEFTGFNVDEIELMLKGHGPDEPLEDPEPMAPPEKAKTEPGRMYQLGEHRLLCGSCTEEKDVKNLMAGEKARMCFTDPPWNVAIGKDSNPRHRQREGLINDDMSSEDFSAFLNSFISIMIPFLDGDLYCVLGASEWPRLDDTLRNNNFHWSATIIWCKDTFVLGRSKFHRRYEPIWYGWNNNTKSSFSGGRDKDDVWEIKRPKRSEEHPTMKPVELYANAFEYSSKKGDVVYEPFGGSGTAILAAEQLGRKCMMMELDPRYCDVIVERYCALKNIDSKNVFKPGVAE